MTETMQSENEVRSDATLAEDRAHMHYALLRVAGRVPDDVLVRCRELLGQDRVVESASTLAFAVTQYRLAVDGRDADLWARLLVGEPGMAARREQMDVVDGDVMTPYVFDHPDGSEPDPFTGELPPPPEIDARVDGHPDDLRIALVEWAASLPEDNVGVWRVVRSPSSGTWPQPRVVWVVEVTDDADAVEVAHSMSRALTDAGVTLPLVEAYHIGTRLPAYQDVARLRGELIWSSDLIVGTDDPRVARVFDWVDAEGEPGFDDEHPRLEEEERSILAEYLAAGEPLLMTTGLIDDVLDTERREVVPLSFRTDGLWIWVDAIEYYLTEHGIAPEPEFLDHLRGRAGTVPSPSGVQIYRALAVMQRGADDDDPDDDIDLFEVDVVDGPDVSDVADVAEVSEVSDVDSAEPDAASGGDLEGGTDGGKPSIADSL